jgi:hypothetical protein
MRSRDLERFVGLPYCARTMDCADLVLLVQAELFGRTVCLPGARPRPLRPEAQAPLLRAQADQLARRVAEPSDGDLVLMTDAGDKAPGHAGTYFRLDHEDWVLHTSHALGGSCLHRTSALPSMGLRIEGYYTWRDD